MSFGNDLPAEHGRSLREPIERTHVAPAHLKNKGKNYGFYPTPPMKGRTFPFFTQKVNGANRCLGFDVNRRGLTVQNLSVNDVYLSVGTPPSSDGTNILGAIKIGPKSAYEFPAGYAPTNDIFLASINGGDSVTIIELLM